ncbi:MAG: n-acetylglutamate synthase [Spirochaetales bacterium]
MNIDYNNRLFRGVSNSENGEVGGETIFRYEQHGTILRGSYAGGAIVKGDLLGTVNHDGTLDFVYHHLNAEGELMAGRCHSVPRVNENGRLMLDESWQWMTGDKSAGESVVAEVTLAELGADVPETIVGAITEALGLTE